MPDADRERRKALLRARLSAAGAARGRGETTPGDDRPPVPTPAQRRMWFLHHQDSSGHLLNISVGYRLRGGLDAGRLRAAIAAVAAAQENLRTTYHPGDNGIPVSRSVAADSVLTPPLDFSEMPATARATALDELLRREAHHRFDLTAEPPLRATVVRCAADEHVMVLVAHHIGWDDTSWPIFFAAVATAYAGGTPAPGPRPDHAEAVARDEDPADLGYWRDTLVPLPEPPDLPGGGAVVAEPGATGPGRIVRDLPADLDARVRDCARAYTTSPFVVLFAGFAALLRRYTGAADFLISVPITDRYGPAAERTIGYFGNTLLLRATGDPTADFAQLLTATRDRWQQALAHRGPGIDQVIRACRPERGAGGDGMDRLVAFGFGARTDENGLRLPDIEVSTLDSAGIAAREPLNCMVVTRAGGTAVELNYRAGAFAPGLVTELAESYLRLLDAATREPLRPLHTLDMLGDEIRSRIAARSHGSVRTIETDTLPALFDAAVTAHGDRPALVSGTATLTYAQLGARANRLAHHLIACGAGTEDIVALRLANSAEFVIAALAVLAAGAAYLPIDPAYPQERIDYLYEDARPVLTLDESAVRQAEEQARGLPATAPTDAQRLRPLRAGNLAYVIYTSGSTGAPKGVPVPHGAITEHLIGFAAQFGMTGEDRLLQSSSVSFDASLLEIFVTLTVGARLVIGTPETFTDIGRLGELVDRHEITVLHMVPSLLETLLQQGAAEKWTTVRFVPVGGEALPGSVADRLTGDLGIRLRNHYGPTEAVVSATHYEVLEPQGNRVVPIGGPNHNVVVHVLDATLRPVPFGTVGEVYLGGNQLARGYLGRPALTAARFVADPDDPGARLFRTGDLARRAADGVLEFIGRTDDQLKIRGYRIEAGEVAAAIQRHPGVEHCLVLRTDHPAIGPLLAAYLVPAAGADLDFAALRAYAAGVLPAHQVPAAFARIDAIPVTAHGKLDRAALPDPVLVNADYRAPRTTAEARMAAVFAGLFELDRVGADDSFFDLGGHSLLAVRLIADIRAEFDISLGVRTVFDTPTVRELAVAVSERAPGARPRPEPTAGPRPEPLPLTESQLMVWLPSRLETTEPVGNLPFAVRFDGPIDTDMLIAALGDVIARHEALRTVFPDREGVPYQHILPPAPIEVPITEVESADRLRAELAAAGRHRFAIDSELLIRAQLFVRGDTDHMLHLLTHHLVTDHVSFRILLTDLVGAYRARHTPDAPQPLSALPFQYADYALWQRSVFDEQSPYGLAEVDYWRATLAGAPDENTVPPDRPRPATPSTATAVVTRTVPAALWARLRTLAEDSGATEFMLCHTAVTATLARLGAGDDILIGTPVAGRADAATNEMVGLFANVVVLRTELYDDPTLRTVLRRSRDTALGAFDHQEVPIARVMAALDPERVPARNALYQVVLHFRAPDRAGTELVPGTRAEPPAQDDGTMLDFFDGAFLDFNIGVTVRDDGAATVRVVYNTALYDAVTADLVADLLGTVFEVLADTPDLPLRDLEPLAGAARHRVLGEWGHGPVPTRLPDLRRLLAADTHPERTALSCAGTTLTYRDLSARLDGAAAPSANKPLETLFTGIAAVLRGEYPGGDLYIGAPTVAARVAARQAGPGGVRIVAGAPDNADTVLEAVAALADGASLVLADTGADSEALARLITEYRPDTVVAQAHTLASITLGGLTSTPSVRTWVVTDASWPKQLPGVLAACAPEATAHFRTGLPEAGDTAITGAVAVTALGHPAPGTRILLLDDRLHPVPHNTEGELYLGGPVLADGYTGDPAATACLFVAVPGTPGGRAFRTGRRARWNSAGELVLDPGPRATTPAAAEEVDDTPPTETERILIAIAEELLEHTGIRRSDKFFAIGGDSVLSIQWSGRATTAGLPLTPRMIFENPTIAQVAAAVDVVAAAAAETGPAAAVAGVTGSGEPAHTPMSASGLSADTLAAVTAAWKAEQ